MIKYDVNDYGYLPFRRGGNNIPSPNIAGSRKWDTVIITGSRTSRYQRVWWLPGHNSRNPRPVKNCGTTWKRKLSPQSKWVPPVSTTQRASVSSTRFLPVRAFSGVIHPQTNQDTIIHRQSMDVFSLPPRGSKTIFVRQTPSTQVSSCIETIQLKSRKQL